MIGLGQSIVQNRHGRAVLFLTQQFVVNPQAEFMVFAGRDNRPFGMWLALLDVLRHLGRPLWGTAVLVLGDCNIDVRLGKLGRD